MANPPRSPADIPPVAGATQDFEISITVDGNRIGGSYGVANVGHIRFSLASALRHLADDVETSRAL